MPPVATVLRICELRERYPRWGREKLRVLLLREGISISAKTIDRTIKRLRERGDPRELPAVRKGVGVDFFAACRPVRAASDLTVRPETFRRSRRTAPRSPCPSRQ